MAAYRCLQICSPDSKLPNAYHDYSCGTFLLHSSGGVKVLSFHEYLETVQAPHTGDYELQRLSITDLNDFEAHEYKWLWNNCRKVKGDDQRLNYAFRTCWYCATKEVIT